MRDRAGKFALAVVLAALLAQPSHAQQRPLPESGRQKSQDALKKGDAEAVDDAYKDLMKRTTPHSDKKVDPWGDVRTPSANSGK
jgi:hypothetical protein